MPFGPQSHSASALASDQAEQNQDEDDGEHKADAASSVVAPTGADAVTAVAKSQDEQNQKQNH